MKRCAQIHYQPKLLPLFFCAVAAPATTAAAAPAVALYFFIFDINFN